MHWSNTCSCMSTDNNFIQNLVLSHSHQDVSLADIILLHLFGDVALYRLVLFSTHQTLYL